MTDLRLASHDPAGPERRLPGAPLPLRFLAFCGLVAAGGIAAGVLAHPVLLWTTPPFVTMLVAAGVRRMRDATQVAVAPGEGPLTLPPGVAPLLAATLDRLPAGAPARTLLADVGRLSASLYASTAAALGDPKDGGVGELVAAACESALALDRVDGTRALLERERPGGAGTKPGGAPAVASRWRDAAAECERTSDALRQRMLETIAALGEACADSGEASEAGSAARLGELARALQHDAAVRRAAAEEVEALLGTGETGETR